MKQSKLIVGLFVAALALSVVGTTYAQTNTTREDREAQRAELRAQKQAEIEARRAEAEAQKETRMQERETMRAEKEAEREAAQADRQAEREARMAERLSEFADTLLEKVSRFYERFALLSEKLAARIAEFEARGLDVTAAQAKLDEADVLLEEAFDDALVLIEQIRSAEVTDREGLGEVISMVSELKNPFRDVLALYKEVVMELRALVTDADTAQEDTTNSGAETE